MTFISKLLKGADENPVDDIRREIATIQAEQEQEEKFRQMQRPAPPQPEPMVVSVALALLKAHDNYTRAEIDLTHRIDTLVEERRQMRVAINSTSAGLYPIHDDPAMPDELKKRIAAAFNDAVKVVIDDADLT